MTDSRVETEIPSAEPVLPGASDRLLAPLICVFGDPNPHLEHLGAAIASLVSDGGQTPPSGLSQTLLAAHCRAMLAGLGASAEHPPSKAPPIESDLLDTLTLEAASSLSSLADTRPVVLCHPSLSLVLDLWRRASSRPVVSVLVVESPLELSSALGDKEGNSIQALATYERYLRRALDQLADEPVFVCHLDRARREPTETAESLLSFLDGYYALSADAERRAAFQHIFDGLSANQKASSDALSSREIETLSLALGDQHGPQHCFVPPNNNHESPWTTEVLRLSGELNQVLDGLLWAARQIEPIVRAAPSVLHTSAPSQATEESPEATKDYDGNGPYPLNAGEDRRSYHRWLSAHRLPIVIGEIGEAPRIRARTRAARTHRTKPLVSILVPVWRTPLWALQRCVGSVLAQNFASWQLCLCDDASGDDELTSYLKSLPRLDSRISVTALQQNSGISAATNAALSIARGEFVGFLDHDDELTPDALSSVAEAIAANRDADVIYSDEDKIDAAGERFDPAFKPEWSPDLLLSFAYLCHLTVIRSSLVRELGGLRSEYDGSQDYDLSLRATERARQIVHIPKVLYHWRTLPGSAAADSSNAIAKPWAYEAGRRVIEDALSRRGEVGEVTAHESFPGRYHVRRAVSSSPLVSIIIPFRDEPALLATCATSLRENPGYDRLELVLVDNESELPETEALLERLGNEPGVRIVRAPGAFNWAAINNAAAKESAGEVLLFANNDIEARVGRWLDALLGHALRPEVGAVGARLVYPDGAIQHAGVVIGLGGIAGHVLRGLPGDHPGYGSMAMQTRNCSVVTGACMMTRAEVFSSVGGFDEHLPVAFNDVDFCLKLREAGYLVVYTPLAELVHHESRSRGHTDDLNESRLILRRWADEIVAGDPYMNVNLSHWRYWCPLSTAQEDERWKTYLKTSVLTRGSSSST